jgi:putative transcriptional regulator
MNATLVGKLLVAMPGIGDPRFDKSVIMLCAHTAEHAMGLIVNKPKEELTLGEVLEHLGIESGEEISPRGVMDGGPVRPDRGYVLHSEDFPPVEGVQKIAPGICLTATRDILEAVGGEAPPQRFLLALGCSGWGPGQLEDELRRNAWLVVDHDEAIVFGADHEEKWRRAIAKLGFDPAQLMGEAGSA